jgi:hypothetical protein
MPGSSEMLDLNHPMSKHILHASALLDGLLVRGQQMSVSPSVVRRELLSKCLPLLEELRDLNATRFAKSAYIVAGIDEFESGLRTLAELAGGQITEDHRDGSGNCPVCGTAIIHYPSDGIVVCGKCDELFMPAKEKLCGFEGFGTEAI